MPELAQARGDQLAALEGGRGHMMHVTSATRMALSEDRAAQPNAGGLFAIYGVGARGLPAPMFAA